MTPDSMEQHQELVESHHRFASRTVAGEVWSFAHLDALAFKVSVDMPVAQVLLLDVVVLFSSHCFTRGLQKDEQVDEAWLWVDRRERRVLDRQRYELSCLYLPRLIKELPQRLIQVADAGRPNFVTLEVPPQAGKTDQARYAVFFEVERDRRRRGRVLLRVQSAYVLPQLTRRQVQADKIKFQTLLRRAYSK